VNQREESKLQEKLKLFYSKLSEPFVQREEEAEVVMLALLSGEHAIFIGEPGTAKSALVRRAASLLKAKYFYYVLNKYTEPDELFGPIDINELRSKGVYKRRIEGKLPWAEIAFLDEIFNANTAILNALLSILQERIFVNGDEIVRTPLISLFSASNTIPDEVELKALYDRLVFRHHVRPVSESKLRELFRAGVEIELKGIVSEEPILTLEELRKLQEKVKALLSKVREDNVFLQKYARLIVIFRENGIAITDRRAIKGLKAVVANAVFEGRNYVEPEDLLALKYVVPETFEDFGKAAAIIVEEIKLPARYLRDLQFLERNLERIKEEIIHLPSFDFKLLDYSKELFLIEKKLRKIARESLNDEQVQARIERLMDIIGEMKEILANKANFYR